MSWKLNVYYLITIHCNQTMTRCSNKRDHMFMFQYLMTRFEHIVKNKCWKQPMFLFNNVILLTLKIGYLLTIYIKHENDLKEFQMKYGFLNVPFTCINLIKEVLHVYWIIQFYSFQIILNVPLTHDFRFLKFTLT